MGQDLVVLCISDLKGKLIVKIDLSASFILGRRLFEAPIVHFQITSYGMDFK